MIEQQIDYSEADNEAFREIARDLVANRLAPLTAPGSLDSLTKGVLPVALAMLVGLDIVSLAAVANNETLKGLRETDLRVAIMVLALLILASAALAAFGRLVIARNAIAAWKIENLRITNRGRAWFFARIREDLVTLKPVLDGALAKFNAAADRAALPGKPPVRLSVVGAGITGRPVRHTTLAQQQLELNTLSRYADHVILEAIPDARVEGWHAALERVRARQSVLLEFLGEQTERLKSERRAFLISFLSLDLLLVPLALTVVVWNGWRLVAA